MKLLYYKFIPLFVQKQDKFYYFASNYKYLNRNVKTLNQIINI